MDSEPRNVVLTKGEHRFIFVYRSGEESAVLDALVAMVHHQDVPFDWFDAAVLSHQIGQRLSKELMQYIPKKSA